MDTRRQRQKARMVVWKLGLNLAGFLLGVLPACTRDFSAPPIPALISGQVVRTANPVVPVEGASVQLVECNLSTVSDKTGAFVLASVPDGSFRLRIDASLEIAGQVSHFSYEHPTPLVTRGPAPINLGTISLSVGGVLTGQIKAPTGTAPLNTVVYVIGGKELALVGDDGRFTLENIPPGNRMIGASKPGYWLASPLAVEVKSTSNTELSLTLTAIPSDARAEVSGEVRRAEDNDGVGIRVLLSERFNRKSYSQRSDVDSRYSFQSIPAGFYQWSASAPGFRTVGLSNIEVRPGVPNLLPTVILPVGNGDPGDTQGADPDGNPDDDGDGWPDSVDNCPLTPNPSQKDRDGNGLGDACDPDFALIDRDGDTIENDRDNCPNVFNPDQTNSDDDPLGDACDDDADNDGIPNGKDKCPLIPNPDQQAWLCDWPVVLVYSAQDTDGSINLFGFRRQPTTDARVRLTQLPGQSWGAAADPSNGMIFFQHKTAPEQPFRICRLSLAEAWKKPLTQPTCLDLAQQDVMAPTVCSAKIGTFLIYERQDVNRTTLDWVALSNGVATSRPASLWLEKIHNLDTAVPGSFRYPKCKTVPDLQGLGEHFELGYSTDFLSQSDPPGGIQRIWASWYSTLALEPRTGVIQAIDRSRLQGSNNGPVLRPCPGSETSVWFIEESLGDLSQMSYVFNLVSMNLPFIQSSQVLDPAFLGFALAGQTSPLKTQGFLAFTDSKNGSSDVLVFPLLLPIPSARPLPVGAQPSRIASTPGWEGSPTWAPWTPTP